MLTKSPLLFRFGSLMSTYIQFVNRNIPAKKETKCFSLLPQMVHFLGSCPKNMFIETKPKNYKQKLFKARHRAKILCKKAYLKAFIGK